MPSVCAGKGNTARVNSEFAESSGEVPERSCFELLDPAVNSQRGENGVEPFRKRPFGEHDTRW